MVNKKDLQKGLLNGLAKEQSLRSQIVDGIVKVLKDTNTEFKFKFCIVMVLFIMFALSLVFCLFIINACVAVFRTDTNLNVPLYLGIISGKVVIMVAVGMPLVFRASSVEEALRLADGFERIHQAKFRN